MLSDEYFQGVMAQLLRDHECQPLAGGGMVVWLTGLSGAGKTTISSHVVDLARDEGVSCIVLDGDALRAIFAQHVGHGRHERQRLALAYARLCQEISARGYLVICATISMFHKVHEWNRKHIPNYLEVYLRVPVEELKRRDPKGLYARAEAGELQDIVGVHWQPEEPRDPHLLLDNCGESSPGMAARAIWELIRNNMGGPQGAAVAR